MKNMIKTITLAVVLSFGATMANAGILVADRTSRATQCSAENSSKGTKHGIIVFGQSVGIIVFGAATYFKTGIIVFGAKDTECTSTTDEAVKSTGIIVFG